MKIVEARLRRVGGALPDAISNAGASWNTREGLLLQLVTAEGLVGQGEASPLSGYSLDTIEQCEAALLAVPFGAVPTEASAVRPWLDAHPLPPAARFAAETALLDIVGQVAGQPLAALLNPAPHPVTLAALLPSPPLDLLAAASSAIARGIRTLKLKIGYPDMFDRELASLAALRREVGPEVHIRLDANGAFAASEASARLAALAESGPELIEEPVPTGEMPSFVRRGPHPIPIAADESLQSPALRKQLIEARLAFGVLKPTVLGGTLACLDLAAVLRAHGGRAIVTHTFEGPVGMAAAAALASALPGDPIAAGLDRHPALAIWPKVPTPSGVGLGVPRLRL